MLCEKCISKKRLIYKYQVWSVLKENTFLFITVITLYSSIKNYYHLANVAAVNWKYRHISKMLTERPRKENRTVASAISSDEPGLSTNDGKSLLPLPSTTRKHGTRSKRRTRHRYLIRSGCVFVSMIFSFFFFSPRSPLYSYGPDNQSPAHDGNFNRKLLQTSPTTDAPARNA